MSLESSTTAAGEHSSPSHHHRAPRFRARSLQKVNEWGDASEPRKVQKRYTNSDTNGTEYEEYQYGSTLITRDKDGVFPIEFSCSNLVQEDWLPLSDAVVSFDLEASFIKDTDVMSNVRALEWSLLNILAETIGLKNDCDLKVQHEDLRRSLSSNPRRALTQTYLDYPTAIISLSSDPDDAHSATTGDCKFQKYDASTQQCFSIRSRMWAKFRGDEMDQVDDYLTTIVSKKLESPNVLFAGNITGITFVGDRYAPIMGRDSTAAGVKPQVEASQGGLASPVLGSVVAASAFAVVIGAILLVARKRRKDSAIRKVEADSLFILDAETGSATDPPQKTNRAPFDQSVQSPTPRAKIMRKKAKGNPSRTPVRAPTQSEGTTDTTDSDSTIPIAGDDQIVASGAVTVAGMSALPPRPPTQRRRNSKNLKTTRRKKKKRKKPKALQRVNSKEGLIQMATISESEDEDSEFGSEYDSDYSTEEEYVSSANNSPVRPKPRTGSRTSTPQLSPKDELFPTDAFSDYDFTLEVPELLDAEEKVPELLDAEEKVPELLVAEEKAKEMLDAEEKVPELLHAEEKPKEMLKPRTTVVPPIKKEIIKPLPPPPV